MERESEAEKIERIERKIAASYAQELRACAELEAFMVGALDPWQGRSIQKSSPDEPPGADEIIGLLFARATKTFKAAILLVRQGYGEQASMLNRSLFEGMVVAHWVTANEGAATERFFRGWRFDRYLLARVLENTGWLPDGTKAPGPDLSEAELLAMRGEFGTYGHKLWTGHNSLRELVDEIETDWGDEGERQMLRNFLRVVNRDNNQLLHSTVSGLAEAATGMADDGLYLSVGPSETRIEQALFPAYWTYAETFGVLIDRFEISVRAEFEEMMQRHDFDFRLLTTEEANGVERNDPCPCGSGEKFKRCHEGRPLMDA